MNYLTKLKWKKTMRMWEIRENSKYDSDYKSRKRSRSEDDDYECGYEDGYKAAMEEAESYSSRRRRY